VNEEREKKEKKEKRKKSGITTYFNDFVKYDFSGKIEKIKRIFRGGIKRGVLKNLKILWNKI